MKSNENYYLLKPNNDSLDKGKPIAKQGRKAQSLQIDLEDSQVATIKMLPLYSGSIFYMLHDGMLY